MINGANITNVEVDCVTNTTTISVNPTGTIPASAAGTATNSISVTNTGQNTAYNVHANLPTGWIAVTQDSSNCDSIPAGGTCNLVFSSTQPYVAQGNIMIIGDNITTPPTMAIAFTIQGYLVWEVSGSISQVIDTDDLSPNIWGPNILTNAQSLTDGMTNTSSITTTLGTGTNAAAVNCYNSTQGGVTSGTWYLPAICQMGSAGQEANCSAGNANIYTNLYQLGFGAFDALNIYIYWSSTEYQPLLPTFNAWYQRFEPIGSNTLQGSSTKSGSQLKIRCARALTL